MNHNEYKEIMNTLKGFSLRMVLYAAFYLLWGFKGYPRWTLVLVFVTIFIGVRALFKEFPFHDLTWRNQ